MPNLKICQFSKYTKSQNLPLLQIYQISKLPILKIYKFSKYAKYANILDMQNILNMQNTLNLPKCTEKYLLHKFNLKIHPLVQKLPKIF